MPLTVTTPLLALFGAATGGLTSYVTLRMFFSPHRGKRWLGMKVPFTPGLFPHIQPRLADRLANDVQQTVLTPTEIHELAQQFLTEANIEKAIDLGLAAVVSEFRNTTKLHALAHDVGRLATDVAGQTVSAVIKRALSGESQVFDIADMVDRAVDFMLSEFELSPKLAGYLSERIMEGPLAPSALRVRLVEFLTPDAIEALSRVIKRHTSGGLGLLLNFVNLRGGLTKFRMFMDEDPDEAEQMISQVLTSADVKGLVEREIREFKLKQLPWSTIEFLKTNTTSYIEHYLATHQDTMVPQILERLELDVLIADAIIRLDPNKVSPQVMGRIRTELVRFVLRYLDQDLSSLVEHFVGAVMIQMIIAERVRRFPSPVLEAAIRETGNQRLTAMVLAGAGLGGICGGLFGWLVL